MAHNVLRVRDGELLEFRMVIAETDDDMEQEATGTESDSSDSDPSDPDSDAFMSEPHPEPDEEQRSQPRDDAAPRGPPPPRPIGRSRSPRRHRSPGTKCEEPLVLHLAASLTAETAENADDKAPLPCYTPTYDLSTDHVLLPHHGNSDVAMFWTWPPEWMRFDVWSLPLKEATRRALQATTHWSQLLQGMPQNSRPEVHLYTDGSYYSKSHRSGYGVAIFLKYANILALFGVIGGQILGAMPVQWCFEAPPPLQAELVALTAALLWVGQGLSFLPMEQVVVNFDCQVAGFAADGSWQACNEYSSRLHDLELVLRGRLRGALRFEYVKAHADNAWNELADTLAKCGAKGGYDLPELPASNRQAFLHADLSWVAAEEYGRSTSSWPGGIPGTFAIAEEKSTAPSPLLPADLLPLTQCHPRGSETHYATSALSVNIQGLGGKAKYVEEQLNWRQCRIAFIQETKEGGGTCYSAHYLRLSTASEKHWGVAIWLHRQLGIATVAGQALIVSEADLSMLVQDKRLLVVRVRKADVDIILFSGHCPHTGRPKERQQFLEMFASCLREYPQGQPHSGWP